MDYHKLSKEELIDLLKSNQNVTKNWEHTRFELTERIKELNCHYKLTDLITNSDLSFDEILTGILSIIPPAFQFPEQTSVFIEVHDKQFSTPLFRLTKHTLCEDLIVDEKQIGKICICYDDTVSYSKPVFLDEEKALLKTIASRISGLTIRTFAQESLRMSEMRYKLFFESNSSIILLIDTKTGEIKDVNKAAVDYYGWTKDELIKMHISEINTLSKTEIATEMQKSLREQRKHFFFKHRIANGDIRDVEVYSGPIEYEGKTMLYSIVHDITERRIYENKLLKANRLISVISNINQAIVKEKDKDSLLAKVCEIAVNYGKFQMAWIGMVNEETKKVVPVFKAGFEDGYLSVIKQISIDENVPEGRGPTGTALREGRFFVTNNIASDPLMAVWRDEAIKRNYHSAIGIPIKCFGKAIGVISLYSSQCDFFNAEELELLNDVLDNVGFALESFEKEIVRQSAENELRKLSMAIEQSPVSIVVTNSDGNIEYVNPMACYTTGYSKEELIGQNPRVLQSGETDKYEYEELWSTISNGSSWNGIFHNKRKNGELYWESSTITPISDVNGNITHYVAIKEDITEKRKADEDLQKFRTIVERANYGSAITTMQGQILYINPAFARMHGYETSAELIDENLAVFHNKEQLPIVSKLLSTLILNGEFLSEEVWHTRKDGSVFPTLMNATVIRNNRNEPIYLSATAIDITERKKMDAELQKLSLAVTQSPDLIVITDTEGTIEFVNPAFEKVTGFTFDMVKGKNTRILKSGKNPKHIYEELWKTIKSGNIWTHEWINIKRNGEYYWEYISISPIHDNAGNIVNFLAIKQDISERKRNEQEIIDLNANLERKIEQRTAQLEQLNINLLHEIDEKQQSEQKFATAFQSNSALMAISDFYTGEYVDVNSAFTETLGYSREEIIGNTNKNLHLFADTTLRDKVIEKIDSGHAVRDLEVEVFAKNKQLFNLLLSADIIYVAERKCLLTVSLDIRDRKIAEEEMRKARSEAEEANIAKSEFLSRMSHELRTPMNSILGFAQILEMGELNAGQKKSVNHILKSGKHLLGLINEVLDISRIEAGRLSISIEPIKVNTVLDEMMDIIRPLANDNSITIIPKLETSDQLFVRSDKQRLKQIILNLLNNAVKYNKPNGNVVIEARKIPSENPENETIRISITDSGIGISKEDIPKIFTPFERISAQKTDIEGTGLGLAVVKKLIDTMGGTLGVESRLGEGSTFWIQLPAAESQLSMLKNDDILINSAEKPVKKAGTILYIEDNSSNIELVEQILKYQRPEVTLISNMNGSSAVALAIEYKPNMILLDLNLPDIHGSKVLAMLKANPITKTIPVVVLSADAMHKQIEKMLQSGADSYLTKPLEVIDFLRVIDEYI